MNAKSKLKLTFQILLLAIVCGGLTLYVSDSTATVPASYAEMELQTYQVGTEYAGIITKQYVRTGDKVNTNQPLFVLRSDTLKQDIANGKINARDLTYKLSSDGELIVPTVESGILSEAPVPVGSFAMAGKSLATITTTRHVSVKATFVLSSKQYAKLSPASPFVVQLANGKVLSGKIRGVNQASQDGRTVTIVTATMGEVSPEQAFISNGLAVNAKLVLDTNTLYDHFVAAVNHVR